MHNLQTNLNEQLEEHKQTIITEYVEFFKSRQRIKTEMRAYTDDTSNKLESLKEQLVMSAKENAALEMRICEMVLQL